MSALGLKADITLITGGFFGDLPFDVCLISFHVDWFGASQHLEYVEFDVLTEPAI